MSVNDRKIGIMGGTFNPIHYGHLRAAEEARELLGLETVLFIPSGNPPLKVADLASAKDRYEITRLAIETNPFFRISDLECRGTGKSYTVETLTSLMETHPGIEFYFILGIDSFLELPLWHRPERLMELTNLAVVSRPGLTFSRLAQRVAADPKVLSSLDALELVLHETEVPGGKRVFLLNVTPMDISATIIRRLARGKLSIKYLLPENVESYIISNKLYQEGSDHL